MPTDHDSIVEALRRYVRLAEVHHKEEAKLALAIRGIEASIPAVESLVAENARLREQIEVLQRAWEAEHALAIRGEHKR